MATNTTVPAIPAPTGIERNTERVLSPIKETLDIWAGRQGNPNNRVVTVRELVDLITTDATISVTISTVPHSHSIYLEKAGGIMTGPLELDDTLQFGAAGQTVNQIVTTLSGAGTNSQLATAAAVEGLVSGHVGASDPHTGYQKESEKSAASGYASLNVSGYVPPGELGSGTPDGTLFLRDDNSWQLPASGSGLFTENATSYSIYGGTGAGASLLTTGEHNFFAGYEAGAATTSGDGNVAIGRQTLIYNQAGGYAIAIGAYALQGKDATATVLGNTIAIGTSALRYMPTGISSNIAIGMNCASYLTGGFNTFVGDAAGYGVTVPASVSEYCTGIGGYSLYSHDGAQYCTAVGYSAGRFSSTGDRNAFFGANAGYGLSGTGLTGSYNTAVGASAGYGLQGSASQNTFVGYCAGEDITTGTTNVAVGMYAGRRLSSGAWNVAVGYSAFIGKTSYTGSLPSGNVAIGYQALSYPDNYATYNVAIGYQCGLYSYGNDFSVFMGYYAGASYDGTTNQGSYNVGIGSNALRSYVQGSNNVAVGQGTLQYLISGQTNVAIGNGAAQYLNRDATDAGYSNVAIGNSAGCGSATGENDYFDCVFIGSSAGLLHKTGSLNVAIGSAPLRQGGRSTSNVAIGTYAGYYLNEVTSSSYANKNVFIGDRAGYGVATTTTEVKENVCIGNRAGFSLDGQSALNVFIGSNAGEYIGANHYWSVAIGYYALNNYAGNANPNTAIGYQAMRGISAATKTAGWNVAVGRQALSYADTATYNVAVGDNPGYYLTTSSENVFIGRDAGQQIRGGNGKNVVIGSQAGVGDISTPWSSYYEHTFVGYRAGYAASTGYGTTAIGSQAGYSLTSGSDNVLIGRYAGYSLTTQSNQLRIANNASSALIEGDFSAETVTVNGDFTADNQPGRNAIINGNFDIWWRGTSWSTNGYGGADRWVAHADGTSAAFAASRQSFTVGQTDVPGGPDYYIQVVATASSVDSGFVVLLQRIENVYTFAAETVTVSFWAKATAAGKYLGLCFYQQFGTGGSTLVGTAGGKVALSTSWQKFVVTVDLPSISGKTIGTAHHVAFDFFFDAGADYASVTDTLGHQSGTFHIAQVQVEAGALATAFERKTYGQTLQECLRYYRQVVFDVVGYQASGSSILGEALLSPPMYTTPAATQITNNSSFTQQNMATTTSSYLRSNLRVSAYRAASATGFCQFSELTALDAEI